MAITTPADAPADDISLVSINTETTSAATPSHEASTSPLDIDSWAVAALASLHIDDDAYTSPNNLLSAPLKLPRHIIAAAPGVQQSLATPRRKRNAEKRERIGKGRVGQRHLRRWDNDHLASVPNAQPPAARDWQVHPTYPVLDTVPYALAGHWDGQRAEEERGDSTRGGASRNLRLRAKKLPALREWVKALEAPVREFVRDVEDLKGIWDLVMVQIDGGVLTSSTPRGVVLDEQVLGHGDEARFKRWLAHEIAEYYGLQSRSLVRCGGRVVEMERGEGCMPMGLRPLWEIC